MFSMLKIAFRTAPKKYLFQQQHINIILLLSNISYLLFLNTYFPPISTTVAVVMGIAIGCISFITAASFITNLFRFWDVMASVLLEKAENLHTDHFVLSKEVENELATKAQKVYIEITRPSKGETLFANMVVLMVITNAIVGLSIIWSIHAK